MCIRELLSIQNRDYYVLNVCHKILYLSLHNWDEAIGNLLFFSLIKTNY